MPEIVHLVGAGPGDPELITVKGMRVLGEADTCLYAGSLVNPGVLTYCRQDAAIVDTAPLTQEEIDARIREDWKRDKKVVRVHSGDPSLYGTIAEQAASLRRDGIPFRVVPGISSFLAAAAALEVEYTVPGVSQSVIITRRAGRTPVPAAEALPGMAAHGTSLCLFLSAGDIAGAVEDLAGGYPADTPAAVVEKVSWPDQRVVRGTLGTIAQQAAAAGIKRQALILVGKFLTGSGERSRLYDPEFTHGYRQGKRG